MLKSYGEKIEIVAQKYFKDFILKKGNYRWYLDKEMKKAGLYENDNIAEGRIMRRLDELAKNKDGSQVV